MTDDAVIRVLIADDHSVVRAGVRDMLSLSKAVRVVAEAASAAEALNAFRAQRPDVTLVDLRMPGLSGIELVQAIRQERPEARVIVLSNCEGDEDIRRARDAGADGYLFKTVPAPELAAAVEAVHAGRKWFPSEVLERLSASLGAPDLTPRELEVLAAMARHGSTDEMASSLGMAVETAKVHVRRILHKLGVETRAQAVATAVRRGILHLE